MVLPESMTGTDMLKCRGARANQDILSTGRGALPTPIAAEMVIDPLIFWDMRSVAVRTTEYTDTHDHNVLALVAAGHGSWVLPPPHGAEGGRMTNHRHSDVSICRRVKLRLLEGGTRRGVSCMCRSVDIVTRKPHRVEDFTRVV